jgi:hypothetical protein
VYDASRNAEKMLKAFVAMQIPGKYSTMASVYSNDVFSSGV